METSPPPQQQGIFPKYTAAIVVLLMILLFPSQAPESLKRKIFPQLWELLRLFFIGLSVCYGIMCSRRIHGGGGGGEYGAGDLDSEPYSVIDASISYFSGISTTSSLFEFSETVTVLNDDKPLRLPIRSLKSGSDCPSDSEIVVRFRNNNNRLRSGRADLAAEIRGKGVRVSRLREEGGKVAAPPPPPAALEYGSWDDDIVGEDRATFSPSPPSRDGPLRQRHGGRIPSSEGEAMDLAEAISDAPESRSSSEMNSQVEDEFNDEIMATMGHDIEKSPSHPLRSWSFWRPTPSDPNPPAPPSPVSSPTASSSPNLAIDKVDDHSEEEAKVVIPSTTTKCPPEDSSSSSSPLIDKKIQSLYSQGRTSGPRGVPRGKSVRTIRPRMLDESKSNASSSSSSRSLIDPLETLSSSLMNTTTRKDADESKSNASASSSRSRSLIDPRETLSLSSSMLMTTPRSGGDADEARPVPPPPDFAGGGKADDDDDYIFESRDDSAASVWNESETSSDDGGKSGRSYFSDDMELGSEVDRKADEFIAKFKEQIRLQKGLN